MRCGIPGEYEKHNGTMIMYPFRSDIWRDNAVHMQKYIIDLVKKISEYEKVYFICHPHFFNEVKYLASENVDIIKMDYDDIWIRDTSPTFAYSNGQLICLDWKFNAWGGRKEGSYYPWDSDNALSQKVSDYFRLPCIQVPVVLEGGAIISDGNGTIFATRSVLLNRNRNPFKSKEHIEEQILEATCDKQLIWIDQGLSNDETNGHIDNILSCISKTDLCLAWTDDEHNPNFKRLHKAFEILENCKNVYGEKYNLHLLPLPSEMRLSAEEARGITYNSSSLLRDIGFVLPASYLNFYMLNGAVLVPSFHSREDDLVAQMIQDLMPNRKVFQIFSREPLIGGGGLHCILHEVPQIE